MKENNDKNLDKAKTFEELWIWQQARELVYQIYTDFAKGTPGYSDYNFKGQIQDAGVSIINNIAGSAP